MKTIKILPLVTAGLFLTACGGGGGGKSSSAVRPDVPDVTGVQLAMAVPTDEGAFTAEINAPRDFVGYDDATDDITLNVQDRDGNSREVVITLNDASDDFDRVRTEEAEAQIARTFGSLVGDESESVYADVYTNDGVEFVNVGLDYNGGGDEVGFRTWVVGDSQSDDIINVGFSTFGSDPFTTTASAAGSAGRLNLTGEANYLGADCIFYADSNDKTFVFGMVELSVNFDTNKVSGTMSEFEAVSPVSARLTTDLAAATINLAEADISTEEDWVGTISTTIGTDTYTGLWSGKFFDNSNSAAGIINGINADTTAAFFGGYIVRPDVVRPDVTGSQLAMALPTDPADGVLPLATYASFSSEENNFLIITLSDGTKYILDERDEDAGTRTIRQADDSLRFAVINKSGDNDNAARDDANNDQINRVFGLSDNSDVDYNLKTAPNGNVVEVLNGYFYYGGAGYLDFGIWLETAATGEIVDQLAFVTGSDPFTVANINPLTGQATYRGGATAVYASADDNVDIFGNVALTANFDNNMINGAITGLRGGYGTSAEFDTDLAAATAGVVLAAADFSTGGTWVGATSTTLAGDAYTGQWGGQFFGNGDAATDAPGYAVGIFNGANAADDAAFVGGYIAEKQ